VLSAVLILSGCTDTSATPIPGIDLSLPAVSEIRAMLPQNVIDEGKFVVAAETSFAPAEFIAEDEHTPIGYDMDLSRAIGQVLGLETQIHQSPFDAIIPAVGSKYDVGISGFTYTEERVDAVDFVTYLHAGLNMAVQSGNPTGIDDAIGEDFDTTYRYLCGRTVGVQKGVVAGEYMQEWSDDCEADGLEPINLLSWVRQADVTTALLGGKIELFAADTPVVDYALSKSEGKLEGIGGELDSAYHGIIFKKGSTQFEEAVRAAVQYLIDNGYYAQILDYWGVGECAIETAEINPDFDVDDLGDGDTGGSN
jgi:polar amino acid transport system substrate-binding protein